MDDGLLLARREEADLELAAERLRRLTRGPAENALPGPDLLFGLARLLEELSRSLAAGRQPAEHAVDAASELAHLVLRTSSAHRRPRPGTAPDPTTGRHRPVDGGPTGRVR